MKIQIECSEKEAQLISRALDFYCRMHLGQFSELRFINSIQKFLWKDKDSSKIQNFDAACDNLKAKYGLLSPGSFYGIFNTEVVQNEARIAANIHQIIRHELWKQDEDHVQYTVDAYPADICKIAEMEEPDFKMIVIK